MDHDLLAADRLRLRRRRRAELEGLHARYMFLSFLVWVWSALVVSGSVVPTDGMVIVSSVQFTAGTYELPHGVAIGADGRCTHVARMKEVTYYCRADISLDMTGVELVGNDTVTSAPTYGVSVLNRAGVTLRGGRLRGAAPTARRTHAHKQKLRSHSSRTTQPNAC